MSDYIPFDIQIEIMKRLPVKSLIQFRSVSNKWKYMIDSSEFIADYTVRSDHLQPQHLLIRYQIPSSEQQYVSIVDDDNTFSQNNKYYPTVPPSVKLFRKPIVVGASHGLVCLLGYYRNPGYDRDCSESVTVMAVVWNPLIRKSVSIVVPNLDLPQAVVFGFGVCPATSDPKILRITDTHKHTMMSCSSSPWLVEVFSLSSRVWRTSSCNPSDKLIGFKWPSSNQVTIDGFIYWLGIKNFGTTETDFHVIISFNLSSEEFREIYLPYTLAFHDPKDLHLLKRSGSLVVLKNSVGVYEVWMMKNDDSNSFTNLSTIKLPNIMSLPLEFWRNGGLVIAIHDDNNDTEDVSVALVVDKSFLEQISDLGIIEIGSSLLVCSYTESLILLDQ